MPSTMRACVCGAPKWAHDEPEVSLHCYGFEQERCLDESWSSNCCGEIELRWPGEGEKQLWPLCEKHAGQRVKNFTAKWYEPGKEAVTP